NPRHLSRFSLLRRREIWVPTIWGWLALALVAATGVVTLADRLHDFLAVTEPVGARVLVVEGWLGAHELNEAAKTFQAGGYQRVLTTGGPIHGWPERGGTFAEFAADYLKTRGVPAAAVTAVPSPMTPQDHTYYSALMVREWAKRSGVTLEALDVFSQDTH